MLHVPQNSRTSSDSRSHGAATASSPIRSGTPLPPSIEVLNQLKPPVVPVMTDAGSVDTSEIVTSSAVPVSRRIFNAVTAPQVLSGTGAAIVLIPDTFVSVSIMSFFAGLSAYNEFKADTVKDSKNTEVRNLGSGLSGFVKEKTTDPGFCTWMQGCTYLGTAVLAACRQQYVKAFSYILFSIGQGAVTSIANEKRVPSTREPLKVESYLYKTWNKLPENLKIVLSDPGAMFPTGNTLLIASTMYKTVAEQGLDVFTSSKLLLGVTLTGLAFAGAAVCRGMAPLFSSKPAKLSGMTAVVGGSGDILIGASTLISSIASGNQAGICVGTATIIWGVSNIILGHRIDPGVFSRIISKSNNTK